jgi:hypothetical protein
MFIIHRFEISVLLRTKDRSRQRQVIPATRSLQTWPVGAVHPLWANFLATCHENQIMIPAYYLQHNIVGIENQILLHSFSPKDYTSLQALCQIFYDSVPGLNN